MTAPETASPAPADTPSQGIPFVSDFGRIIRAMFSPGAVFDELRPRPRVLWPWLAVTVLFGATSFLLGPYQMQVQRAAMEARGQTMPAAAEQMGRVIGIVSMPIVVIALAAIGALILWVTVSVTGGEARFKQALSINLHSWGPLCIMQLVTWFILRGRGVEAIRGPSDMMVPLGLDLLLPAESVGFVRGVMNGFNPFTIWSMVIVAVGLQVMLKLKASSAWTAAIITFVIGLLISATIQGMFS